MPTKIIPGRTVQVDCDRCGKPAPPAEAFKRWPLCEACREYMATYPEAGAMPGWAKGQAGPTSPGDRRPERVRTYFKRG